MDDFNKIPKVIHYCWFGRNEKPAIVQMCILSWKKNLPGYQIVEWNEDNFDINCCAYTKQAYETKKYAFVSDYARFYILYNNGGIYLDTDVEVLKPFDQFLKYDAFTGFESEQGVNPGLVFGAAKGNLLVKELLGGYENRKFILDDGSLNTVTIVKYTTDVLVNYGLKLNDTFQVVSGLAVYPRTYFSPISYDSLKSYFSKNTYSIHHFAATWKTRHQRIKNKIARILGNKTIKLLSRLKRKILNWL